MVSWWSSVGLLCLTVPMVLLLQGCGAGDPSGTIPNKNAKTTVIVMRHCVRAVRKDVWGGKPWLQSWSNYSAQPWPEFPVPDMHCLRRGEQIIEAQARWIRSHGGLPQPVRAVADLLQGDEGQRDNVTMHQLLRGLGIVADSDTAALDHRPFTFQDSEDCRRAQASAEDRRKAMERVVYAATVSEEYQRRVQFLYEVLGVGAAGDWTQLGCNVSAINSIDDPMTFSFPAPFGTCSLGSAFAERLLMEWGGGMDVGWGRVKPEHIPALMAVHRWFFSKLFAPPEIFQVVGASMARAVLGRLTEGAEGTHIFVGHDSDLMLLNLVLDIIWDAYPFPVNATLPGSMLRFDRDGDTVTANYVYPQDFGEPYWRDRMLTEPAKFSGSSNVISLQNFQDRVEQRSIAACAHPMAPTPLSMASALDDSLVVL